MPKVARGRGNQSDWSLSTSGTDDRTKLQREAHDKFNAELEAKKVAKRAAKEVALKKGKE